MTVTSRRSRTARLPSAKAGGLTGGPDPRYLRRGPDPLAVAARSWPRQAGFRHPRPQAVTASSLMRVTAEHPCLGRASVQITCVPATA